MRDDSEAFTYNRTWEQIEEMLYRLEQRQNRHYMMMQKCKKQDRMYHMRQYKGLEGAINMARWVLGDRRMTDAKVIGDE
tara:strand:+ start:316 stop:552 length:237 start_codon:yes stop_codon:yes gene_type:complete